MNVFCKRWSSTRAAAKKNRNNSPQAYNFVSPLLNVLCVTQLISRPFSITYYLIVLK